MVFILTVVVALSYLQVVEYLRTSGKLTSITTRKFTHIGIGALFVLCWGLYSELPEARYAAAAVPLGITLKFLLIGVGLLEDKATVETITRNNDRSEILKGPFIYGLVITICTVKRWGNATTMEWAQNLCGLGGLHNLQHDWLYTLYEPLSEPWLGTASFWLLATSSHPDHSRSICEKCRCN
ncbi:hypothetical protein SARC_09788 [Sphaeroforma arctica JP610]|uniref:Dolichol kinase n=1 Tax=Sphaeroforma arctica JP610 TaxID=667725 RepID=A0A0L0FLY0_9EUKA|nr:hypothetical protein SARC_09788 [Sphaeroforma arctica JP610]KNC77760.1 hypothetical protein SARC_09788 [Sphaeroforma arctica JP610]|eukprot:XP_014151662.1 hypothetical protein SARC_09788 [Sphaeroforma arctica JP610]